jgi:hypothetical protein
MGVGASSMRGVVVPCCTLTHSVLLLCVLQGPPAIGKGVSAAVKDRFPEIKEVVLV